MYRCELCGDIVKPGTPAIKRVVESREREYPPRADAPTTKGRPGGRRRRVKGDPGGSGREIVCERLLCPVCAERDPVDSADR